MCVTWIIFAPDRITNCGVNAVGAGHDIAFSGRAIGKYSHGASIGVFDPLTLHSGVDLSSGRSIEKQFVEIRTVRR